MIVEMGKGEWLFSSGVDANGVSGLVIRKADGEHTIGEVLRDSSGSYEITDQDIFIKIPNLQSAVVLQERILEVCLVLCGFEKLHSAQEKNHE